MNKLMFGKLISKLQLSKSPEEREGKKYALIMDNFSMHKPTLIFSIYNSHCVSIFFLLELLSNMAQLHAFSCHQLGKYLRIEI